MFALRDTTVPQHERFFRIPFALKRPTKAVLGFVEGAVSKDDRFFRIPFAPSRPTKPVLSFVEGAVSKGERSSARNSGIRIGTRVCLALLLVLAVFTASGADVMDANTFFTPNLGDLQNDLAEARAEGKQAMLLMFEQEGCPGCAHMRRNVLSRKDVQEFYRRHFINLSIDIHGAIPLKDPSGREATEKTYAQAIKVRATPTFVFYDLKGAEIARLVGPLETAEEFILLGQFVASGAYKTHSFAQYRNQRAKGG
jgi:thioredoxin-related protein